jgi:hypothetical protein
VYGESRANADRRLTVTMYACHTPSQKVNCVTTPLNCECPWLVPYKHTVPDKASQARTTWDVCGSKYGNALRPDLGKVGP